MGILSDAAAIIIGIFVGDCCKKRLKFKINQYFALAVMIISLLGFVENVFTVSDNRLMSADIIVIVFSLIFGSVIGDLFNIDEKLNNVGKKEKSVKENGFWDAVFLFGIGGLQIGGPILMAINGDNSQLYLKAMIDFPFALLIGATYGKFPVLSFIPVAAIQVIVALIAYFCGDFISQTMLMSLCAIGYVILFFTGFNMVSRTEIKFKTTNMVPSMIFVIIFYVLKEVLI